MHENKGALQSARNSYKKRRVQRGATASRTYFEAEDSEISPDNIKQKSILNLIYFQMNNATVLPWLLKMGGTENMSITKLEHGDLEVPLGASNHDYCRLSCKPIKCGGRLAILKLQGPIVVETLSKNILTDQWSRAPQIE